MRIFPALTGLLCFLAAGGAMVSAAPRAVAAPATLHADHPLAGTLWDTRSGKAVGQDVLFAEAAAATWVLLGEKHDNAVHHRLQARVVGALGAAGRRMAVIWEMAEPEHGQALRDARLETVDALGAALAWEARGWPDWADYQPIAEQALHHGLPMLPGKPPGDMVRDVARGGALPEATVRRLGWARPYPPALDAGLREELAASHCGALPDATLGPMAEVQRFWDAWIAATLREAKADTTAAGTLDGAILIAGSGHVREDRAVPWHLDGESLTLALVEVVAGRDRTADYPSFDPRLFDYVWFTPRVDDEDPCDAFAKPPQ